MEVKLIMEYINLLLLVNVPELLAKATCATCTGAIMETVYARPQIMQICTNFGTQAKGC